MLNDHNYIDKSQPWQGAIAVPLVCAGPGIRRNASVDVPMATVDIGATMLDVRRDLHGCTRIAPTPTSEGAPSKRCRTRQPWLVATAGLVAARVRTNGSCRSFELCAPPPPSQFAGAERDSGMTALSFRGLLEGADPQTRNRTVVLSGLQSYDFGAPPDPNMVTYDKFGVLTYNFRLAVAEFDGTPYKFVCCKGRCPGSPSPVGKPDADGYTRLLYDTAADPFDMHDVKAKLPHVAEKLRAALPVEHGFKCSRAAS